MRKAVALNGAFPPTFLVILPIDQPTQTANALRGIDMAARSLGDTELLARVYRAALVHWTDPDVYGWVYRDHIGELPTDVREALIARAQAILDKADSYDYQRAYAKEVLRAVGRR